jgi:hypothetical protein
MAARRLKKYIYLFYYSKFPNELDCQKSLLMNRLHSKPQKPITWI